MDLSSSTKPFLILPSVPLVPNFSSLDEVHEVVDEDVDTDSNFPSPTWWTVVAKELVSR